MVILLVMARVFAAGRCPVSMKATFTISFLRVFKAGSLLKCQSFSTPHTTTCLGDCPAKTRHLAQEYCRRMPPYLAFHVYSGDLTWDLGCAQQPLPALDSGSNVMSAGLQNLGCGWDPDYLGGG